MTTTAAPCFFKQSSLLDKQLPPTFKEIEFTMHASGTT
jgi:hypothetical protein